MAEKEGGGQEVAEQPAKRVCAQKHCSRCGKAGHNTRTCRAEIIDLDGSGSSK